MKITPFQQILKSEMARLESIAYSKDNRVGGQLAFSGYKVTKKRHFLLQFLGLNIYLA
jgi:hypothetical protein